MVYSALESRQESKVASGLVKYARGVPTGGRTIGQEKGWSKKASKLGGRLIDKYFLSEKMYKSRYASAEEN